jgi:SAM-dependent methyltransferase
VNLRLGSSWFELEVIPGLAAFAQAELRERFGKRVHLLPSVREDRVPFRLTGDPGHLLALRRSVAAHQVTSFDIPRPKALLGHQNFETLVGLIEKVLTLHRPGSFETFRISAAGAGSSVFSRIKSEVETRTGLQCNDQAGDLLLAVRRPQGDPSPGWEVAVRLSPKPLAARSWRVCDMRGALNGTVASVMMGLTLPSPEDRVLNFACGSGTLLIERLALQTAQRAVGCDVNTDALACARQNLIASGHASAVMLLRCDAGRVPLPDYWATTVCADLPFGMLVGSHQDNQELYPRLVAEASRLTRAGGKLVVITQEVRLFERVSAASKDQWDLTHVIPVKIPVGTRGSCIHPRIFLLNRR